MSGSADSPLADLTAFRERPFLESGGEYVPLDSGFVLDKAGRSLLWTAVKAAPQAADRELLLQQWGELFELYVNSILANSVRPPAEFVANPRFESGAEAFDACIVERSTLIVFEHKANTIASAIRYADDPSRLRDVLENRFVQGTRDGRKGLAQLSNSILRFAAGERIVNASTGAPIEPMAIAKIFPVLVHIDNALRTPGIAHYMAARFKELGRVRRIIVTPLVLLPVTELEELEGELSEFRMPQLLESFLTVLKSDRGAVFFARMLPILAGRPRKPCQTVSRFREYLEGAVARLFPGASA